MHAIEKKNNKSYVNRSYVCPLLCMKSVKAKITFNAACV